uniref:VWFA domain-containing protein n=1 Tax=Panagrellus redivivus TaxID=6233 RepID=A0A7E4V6C0_PANRE
MISDAELNDISPLINLIVFVDSKMTTDVVAFLDVSTAAVALFTPTQVLTVATAASTLEDAVSALLQKAPPSTVEYTLVLNYTRLQCLQRSVEALQKAGYTNIETIEVTSLSLSSNIWNLPLNCANGELVLVVAGFEVKLPWHKCVADVIQKCENGWRIIDATALAKYPSARNYVVSKGATEADKTEIGQYFGDRKLHMSVRDFAEFRSTFIRNRINKGNLDGYEVLPYCHYDLLVKFGSECLTVALTGQVPPFTVTKEVDVGNAATVEIHADEHFPGDKLLVKTFKFKSAATRTVSITINVDKTLLPQVSLKTITTRESEIATTVPPPITTSSNPKPDDRTPSMIFNIMNMGLGFLVANLNQNGSNVVPLPTLNNVIAYMRNQTSNYSTAVVNFNITDFDGATVPELKTFRDNCRKAGFPDVRMIPYKSTTFSLILSMLQINIQHGQSVAVLYPAEYNIIVRDGEHLKVRDHGGFNISKVNSYNVDRVIIMNMNNDYTRTQLANLKSKLRSKNVRVVEELDTGDDIPFLLNSKAAVSRYTFNNFCDFDIDIKGHKLVSTRFKEIPFSVSEEVPVNRTTSLEVHLRRSETKSELLKSFTFARGTKSVRIVVQVESAIDITVTMDVNTSADKVVPKMTADTVPVADKDTVNVDNKSEFSPVLPFSSNSRLLVKPDEANRSIDRATGGTAKRKKSGAQRRKEADLKASKNEPTILSGLPTFREDKVDEAGSTTTLPEELSQLQLDPPPKTILTFTSDNRVLINADGTYTGTKEVLAYVRLQDGKAPEVGQKAFDALKEHPDSVYYDITRLLATDFNPHHPNPSWRFKTSRHADGKLVIRGGDGIVTFPIVLFGLVVRSTLLYIQEHVKSEVALLGIRLPTGSTINDADLKVLAQRIGVAIVIA